MLCCVLIKNIVKKQFYSIDCNIKFLFGNKFFYTGMFKINGFIVSCQPFVVWPTVLYIKLLKHILLMITME